MFSPASKPLTIGFLSSWHVYEGASAEPYSHALMKGIRAAAEQNACRLFLGCGIGPLANDQTGAPAWPDIENENTCFVPVGPWNTDGLIVLSTEMTPPQQAYLQSLRQRRFPVIFAGSGEAGPSVSCDNSDGIRQAVQHLYEHGHRQIALIAGLRRTSGDSTQRQNAFLQTMAKLGLPTHPELIAHGFHSYTGGQRAMREILASGLPFSGLVASNDRSALGAIQELKDSGKRVPEDVAVIGFDDIIEAKAHAPGLTTLHNDSFRLGYQAAVQLIALIHGAGEPAGSTQIPAPIIIRQSCGCAAFSDRHSAHVETTGALDGRLNETTEAEPTTSALLTAWLDDEMQTMISGEAQFASRPSIRGYWRMLAAAFVESIRQESPEHFRKALTTVLDQAEAHGDDLLAWNSAISVLRINLDRVSLPGREKLLAGKLLDDAWLAISENARQVFARQEVQKIELNNRLNMMTAQLLAALDFSQARTALDQHLSELGVQRMLVALYRPEDADPIAYSEVIYAFGFAQELNGEKFVTRQFPPAGWFSPGIAQNLSLLPVVIPGRERGFAVFETQQLEPLAVIIRSLVSALRTSLLYADAVQGRIMAEEADKVKGRFLSMVSHELRTPLNVIAGLSEVLLQQKGQPPGPDLWQDMERIYANSQHLGRLIGDVLDLVSSGVGRLRLLHEPLALTAVLRPVLTTGEQMARNKGLAWAADVPERGPFVLGDRTRLRQVALNLISNAVKFTYHGEIRLTVATGQSEVTVSVDDTGIGVPPEEQHKLFADFGQSDISVRKGMNGIGLGLAITRELVERQGGKISVTSPGKTGCGSTFSFTLPTIAQPEAQVVSLEPPTQPLVLVLTHQAAGHDALTKQLQAQGVTIEICNLAEQTHWQERLFAAPLAALILDETVAVQQGWEILAMLKRHEATAHLPVLVCGLDRDTDRGAVINLDYQLKPLNASQISRALNAHGIRSPLSTIMIVDDHAAIRAYHARLLQQQLLGCRILEAENGHEALEVMSHLRPDLVLLDLIMPEVDGFTVLDEMRRRETTRDIPVIVLTAKMITDEDITRLNQGVAAILSKGMFSGREILNHILNVLEKTTCLGTASQRLVRGAIAYIHAHYAESLTRDQIAEHVSISPDHLSDCFHQEMGITPIAYLNRYRICQARKLLEEGGRSITQVALDVGFSDSAHFSHVFQREVGVSPRNYQRSHRHL